MLPSVTHHTSINYRDIFRPLISLHQDTDIFSIVQKELDRTPCSASSAGFLSTFFSSASSARSTVEVEKLFRKKIKGWIDLLDQHLEDNRYNPVELPDLQEAVRSIYVEGKTVILEQKLKVAGLLSAKTIQTIEKLNKFLLRVLRAPHVSKIAGVDSFSATSLSFTRPAILFGTTRPMRSIAGLSMTGALSVSRGSVPVDPAEIHREMIERAHQIQIRRRAKEVSLFNPKWGEGWEDKIIQAIARVDKEEVIKELGSLLTPIQLIVIVQYLLQKSSEDWKLVFLFCSLNTDTLMELLPSFETSQLYLIRASISRGAEQNREWFAEAVKNQALSIKLGCKFIEDKVNAMATRFEEEERCHLLTEQDVQVLHELAENIRLRLAVLCEKLEKVYDPEVLEKSVIETLFTEVPERFKLLHKRLTEMRKPEEFDIDLIWPLIFEKVFGAADLDDDEEAMEMLGVWSIINPRNYFESGLFGDITEDEYKNLTDKHSTTQLFRLGIDNLSHLDIKHISDWKRLEIFNANMLKNYLARKTHAQALKARSLRDIL